VAEEPEDERDVGIVRALGLAVDPQRALEAGPRPRQVPLRLQQQAQAADIRGEDEVIRAESLLKGSRSVPALRLA
jgi:hypothetical protein